MRYHILATDYDGTIAENEQVSASTLKALVSVKDTGRKIILVTGRELSELMSIFPAYTIFDFIVAENGAVVYSPSTLKKILLGKRPPETFTDILRNKGIPLSVGEVIVATWEPHEEFVLECIKSSGLEYQLIFNKGAVMILPPGINKATGLQVALNELGLSVHNMVAVGDAENDNAMLQSSECSVAVSNALDQLKSISDIVTDGARGEGVSELIKKIIATDLSELDKNMCRHYLQIGKKLDGQPFEISPYGANILIAGASGCGKTTLAAAFIGKIIRRKYQFCLIDPEGDYQDLPGAITIGDSSQPPLVEHVIKVLQQTSDNVIICFLAIPYLERPAFFHILNEALMLMRKNTGHPHFIIIDECHHLLPKDNIQAFNGFPEDLFNIIALTTRPELLSIGFLKQINMVMAMGHEQTEILASFSKITGLEIQTPMKEHDEKALLVWKGNDGEVVCIRADEPDRLLMRHKRKYACGDMKYNSFYFTGPSRKLNLKASNLLMFVEMGKGIDDETWTYHLCRHDYSNWIRYSVKDKGLAELVQVIEEAHKISWDSRRSIFELILGRYTQSA